MISGTQGLYDLDPGWIVPFDTVDLMRIANLAWAKFVADERLCFERNLP